MFVHAETEEGRECAAKGHPWMRPAQHLGFYCPRCGGQLY